MLGLVYIGSIIYYYLGIILFNKFLDNEIENKGYKEKEQKPHKMTTEELKYMLSDGFFLVILSLAPIINIVSSSALIFCSKDEFINDMIKNGELIKQEDIIDKNIETVKAKKQKVIEEVDTNSYKNDDIPKVVVYNLQDGKRNELTREEKIEFLKQEYIRLTNQQLQRDDINKKGKGRILK